MKLRANFDYDFHLTPMDSFDVEDIGNCCISASNDVGEFYFFISRTVLGITRIMEYGPFKDGSFPLHAEWFFDQFDYNEKKLYNRIDKFLNNRNRVITQVSEEKYEDVKDKIINFMEYLNG